MTWPPKQMQALRHHHLVNDIGECFIAPWLGNQAQMQLWLWREKFLHSCHLCICIYLFCPIIIHMIADSSWLSSHGL